MAKNCSLFWLGDGASTADVTGRRHGGQGAALEPNGETHGLARHSYKDVSSWQFGDFVFSWNYDFFADGTKARRLGFHEYVDTEAMFMNIFADFRKRKVIP